MKLVELLDVASAGYDDEFLKMYYTRKGTIKRKDFGDGLARFIVTEIAETFDDGSPDEAQLGEAIRVMENAKRDIEGVINTLEEACTRKGT